MTSNYKLSYIYIYLRLLALTFAEQYLVQENKPCNDDYIDGDINF